VDFNLDLLKRHLKSERHNTLSSSCGDSGLPLVKMHQVGVTISDQSMPGMDGIKFLNEVRDIDDKVLLIMMTGNGTLENALDAIKQLKILAKIHHFFIIKSVIVYGGRSLQYFLTFKPISRHVLSLKWLDFPPASS